MGYVKYLLKSMELLVRDWGEPGQNDNNLG